MEWKEYLSIIVPLVLSVISIVIAILSSRSTSKAAAKQIESLKQLVEKQGQEIKEVEKLSFLHVKSDIENLNIEILRLQTEQTGMEYKIRQFVEIENDRFRSLVGDAPTQKDKDQQELLKKKKVLLEKQIKTLHERKSKLEKGATA